MPTCLELAYLANDAYSREQGAKTPQGVAMPGWQKSTYKPMLHGFQGFYYTKNNVCVIAFKGTDGANELGTRVDDLLADGRLGIGGRPAQMSEAAKLTKEAQTSNPGHRFVVVGHSLGGGLAQVIAAEKELPFVTFNAPPMASNLGGYLEWLTWMPDRAMRTLGAGLQVASGSSAQLYPAIRTALLGSSEYKRDAGINIRVENDIVSGSWWGGPHVGEVVTLPFWSGATTIGAAAAAGTLGGAHSMTTVCKLLLDNPRYGERVVSGVRSGR